MKKLILLLLLAASAGRLSAQSHYFPPLAGNGWDTLSPASLNWCPPRIDSLYQYLAAKNTDAFIILVNGRIVLERYFGTYTRDSVHYWASAGKSLAAVLTGIAQDKGFLHVSDSVYKHLGAGWTAASPAQEKAITIRHLLSMTSGLHDNPPGACTGDDTTAACLLYLAPAGTRWAYHNGAYKKLHTVISTAAGTNLNVFTNQQLGNRIGMTGLWLNGVFYSTARRMARFGLLALNNGIWGNDTVLHDPAFVQAMSTSSQNLNNAYGYLWWLNGKSSFMLPTVQTVFNGPIIPNAPADMFCALGKDDQKIYVVPGRHMVVIRQGSSAGTTPVLALSSFDNELWRYIDSLDCGPAGIGTTRQLAPFRIFPNPATDELRITASRPMHQVQVLDMTGRCVYSAQPAGGTDKWTIPVQRLPAGVYLIRVSDAGGHAYSERFRKN